MDLWEVIKDVEGADVELVNRKNKRIASDDERQRSDFCDAVCNPDWKLSLKVLSTFLKERLLLKQGVRAYFILILN